MASEKILRFHVGKVLEGLPDLFIRVFVVFQLFRQEHVIGGEVEVAVTAEIEDDHLLLLLLPALDGLVDGRTDGMSRFRSRDGSFRPGKEHGGLENRVLVVGYGLHEPFIVK